MRRISAFVALLVAALLVFAVAAEGSIVSSRTAPQTSSQIAPTYKEVYRPGPGERVRGAVLVIHGGGWVGGVQSLLDYSAPSAKRFARWGYITWSVDYRSGIDSMADVKAWYEQMRKAYPRLPLCAMGQSAGGHLALWLAAYSELSCVIDEAGPTHLPSSTVTTLPRLFPNPQVQEFISPVNWPQRLRDDRLLIAHLRNDQYVPVSQSKRLRRLVPGSQLILLKDGALPFTHGAADATQLAAYQRAQKSFLGQQMKRQLRR